MSDKEKMNTNCEHKSNSLKIKNITVNVKSCFYPEKNLCDILFSIVSIMMKEKSA